MRPQGTEEKGTACTLEKQDLNPVDAFGALLAKCLGAEPPRQKECKKGVLAHKGCKERLQKGGSSVERGLHKGRTKGAERMLEPPFQEEGCVWKIHKNGPFRTKVKISLQRGR